MTKDELKNRISMAIKDPTLQQGFEIICRELADLQKEVIDLRRDKEDLIFVRNAKADHINELKEQIEKMKCCYNCSKWNDGQCKSIKDGYFFHCADFGCDKWEIKEND